MRESFVSELLMMKYCIDYKCNKKCSQIRAREFEYSARLQMWVGIHKKTRPAMTRPISILCVVTATYPINAGAPPENPPKMILIWLLLFNHLLYTMILSNNPKAIRAIAQILINHAN